MNGFDLKGRRKIYSDETKITEDNVIQVLQDALQDHDYNRHMIHKLMNYEKGIQPILERVKEVRSEINEKVCQNLASKITDFKVGYEFGSPITYVQRAKYQVPGNDPENDDKVITALNDMLYEEKKFKKDVELARYFKTCGIGYRLIRPKRKSDFGDSVFDIFVLNPETTFVIYRNDVFQRKLMGVTFNENKDGNVYYSCYTEDRYYLIKNAGTIINGNNERIRESKAWSIENSYKFDGRPGVPNIPNMIPIFEYQNNMNRQGCFEKVIPLLDAINLVNSDRCNDISQHVQAILLFMNCELPENYNLSDGLIQVKTPNGSQMQANVKYISDTLNQQETQTFIDYLTSQAMEIAHVPVNGQSPGGNTGMATSMSNGWQDCETAAFECEEEYDSVERDCIKLMLEIMKISDECDAVKSTTKFKISDIEIKHNRNKTYDMSSKATTLATLINTGIELNHALKVVDLFQDVQSVYNDSKEIVKKMQENRQQPKQTNPGEQNAQSPDDQIKGEIKKDRIQQEMSDQHDNSPISKL